MTLIFRLVMEFDNIQRETKKTKRMLLFLDKNNSIASIEWDVPSAWGGKTVLLTGENCMEARENRAK